MIVVIEKGYVSIDGVKYYKKKRDLEVKVMNEKSSDAQGIIAKNVKLLIESEGITQAELARKLGMCRMNLNMKINQSGGGGFTINHLIQLSKYFGVTVDWLLGLRVQK